MSKPYNIDDKRFLWKWTLLVTFVSSSLCENFQLIILHNNDMHGRFEQENGWGGFARTAEYIITKRAEALEGKIPPVLFLNAGDIFTGTIWFSVHRWKIAAAFIRTLNPEVMSLGNHEFDDKIENLCAYVKHCGSPIVCANCNFTLEPEAEKVVLPSYVLNVMGKKIGIIGYLTPDTKLAADTGRTIFEPEVDGIRREALRLKKDGISILIALGHSGWDMDIEIAESIPEIDVVVGGHTNTFLWHKAPSTAPSEEVPVSHYPTMIERDGAPACPVVQAYAYTKYIGHLSLTFNEEGELLEAVTNESYVVFLNESYPQNTRVLRLLKQFRPEVEYLRKSIVGKTEVNLDIDLCRREECNIANMVLDAFIDYKALHYNGTEGWTDCPIAILNGGAVRTSIPAGFITQGDLYTTMPFFQKLISFSIYGHQIKKTLEAGVRAEHLKEEGEFIQVSGIHYSYDRLRPIGHRVSHIRIRCGNCEYPIYEPMKFNKLYRLITNTFLANGGDGHSSLKNRLNSVIEDGFDTEVVEKYLEFNEVVRPEIESRIFYKQSSLRTGHPSGHQMMTPFVILILYLNTVVLFLYLCVNL